MTRVLALLLLAVALAPPAAMAHSHKKKGLEIVHPWTFATSGNAASNAGGKADSTGGGTTLVFMKIKNRTGASERLVGASTAAATKVELHEPAGEGASPPTKPVAAVPIAAAADVELTRSGPHLVLRGLKKRLDAYDTFKLTLVFARSGRVVVDVMVEESEAAQVHKH